MIPIIGFGRRNLYHMFLMYSFTPLPLPILTAIIPLILQASGFHLNKDL
jgi:hypothetical protein